ncbi:hypothetical protein PR202_ga13296 [Eleusine coracana subsp. coracana]|uniref:Uncharacterized protein n=1 Tax=Eleusine coracana subsp. coracana TaxID=191504 RepID=A0AAV5CDP4_ELECO|nr:hypothetical protein QOZ80_3AG0218050 [Eleusine coracana subsp. coracana]GJM96457.1 hypothetical protein PR202_ga13296 [Eleusine coracana subsp. coracana]
MLRQSSSRNQRSKGLKLKKALQISLLVLVSVWLLYQVKHSYEKKKSYSEDEPHEVHKDDKNQEEVIRLGRKDLPARMDADSSTLDERTEDDENDEMEQEMKHDENDEDPIDEQDLDKDDDLPEPGEHSSDKDGDDVGVFEDEEKRERSQEDQEKTFHGDNVSSAVSHDPPSSEQEEMSHHAQEKILFVDDASTAVPHEKQETKHEEEVRKAREKSFRGDDVSSSVDHDAKVTKPLPDEQLNNMDRIFEGTTNLSNGILFHGPGVNGSNAAEGQHVASLIDASSHLNANVPNMTSESNAHPTPVNLTNNHDQTKLTLKGEQQNSTLVLNNQVQLLTDQVSSVELHSPPNGTLASVTGVQEIASGADNDKNTGLSSTSVDNKVEGGDARKENIDVSTKIVNRAMTEDEVLPE